MTFDVVVQTRCSSRTAVCAVGAALLLQSGWACRRAATAAAPPPPDVSVLTVAPETVSARFEFVGQAAASRRVEVRAQVAGVIVARPYAEGTDVPKGALLFQIDSTTYDAAYRSARAQLADAAARLANAERNWTRLKALLGSRAVAQKDVDDAETASDQARAAVQAAQAAVDRAKKDYDDTFIRAEIAGRAGRALLDLGARVTGPSDLLTTVEQIDPVYVNFSPSDQEVLRWRQDIATRRLLVPARVLAVQVTLADGSIFPGTGQLNFIDLALQPTTGTLSLRAEFRNPRHVLLPGQFVRLHFVGLKRPDAILVPQRAVQRGLAGAFVYVLGDSNRVTVREVVATSWDRGAWLIEQGLRAGDRLVVDGIQKVAPGQLATPVAYRPAVDSSAAAGGGDSAVIAAPSAPPKIKVGP
ncbi:MAG: efflux transporter periplasmic adaptor subunit [Gemmatimonadetes bacterium]|nr:MAG: efflux transporter periplasmic adaptor subunit [Gemmatimonadota bacterium]